MGIAMGNRGNSFLRSNHYLKRFFTIGEPQTLQNSIILRILQGKIFLKLHRKTIGVKISRVDDITNVNNKIDEK